MSRQLTRGELISRGRRRARRARKFDRAMKKLFLIVIIIGTIISVMQGLGSELNEQIDKIHAQTTEVQPMKREDRMKAETLEWLTEKLTKKRITGDENVKRVEIASWTWDLAAERGMKPEARQTLIKVIECESSFYKFADNTNAELDEETGKIWTSLDRGIAQWNDYWHPEIPAECVWDEKCAINEMITIVNRDGNFGQWHCINYIK